MITFSLRFHSQTHKLEPHYRARVAIVIRQKGNNFLETKRWHTASCSASGSVWSNAKRISILRERKAGECEGRIHVYRTHEESVILPLNRARDSGRDVWVERASSVSGATYDLYQICYTMGDTMMEATSYLPYASNVQLGAWILYITHSLRVLNIMGHWISLNWFRVSFKYYYRLNDQRKDNFVDSCRFVTRFVDDRTWV